MVKAVEKQKGIIMTPNLRAAVVLQVVYAFLAILVALVIWGILGEFDSKVDGVLGKWRLGGPFAGFVFVYLLLLRSGLVDRFIEVSGKMVKAEVLLTPVSKNAYVTLFDGYNNCDYIAFNSPFRVEEVGQTFLNDALAIHEKRYLQENVKSRYLFCEKDSYERAKSFFKKLEKRVGKDIIDSGLEIRFIDIGQPGYTYFGGRKNGVPACVIYPAARFQGGLPDAVVYLENAPNLLTLLMKDFNEKWDKAKGDN